MVASEHRTRLVFAPVPVCTSKPSRGVALSHFEREERLLRLPGRAQRGAQQPLAYPSAVPVRVHNHHEQVALVEDALAAHESNELRVTTVIAPCAKYLAALALQLLSVLGGLPQAWRREAEGVQSRTGLAPPRAVPACWCTDQHERCRER